MKKKTLDTILYIVLFYLALAFILFPIFNTFYETIKLEDGSISFHNYREFFSKDANIEALKNTIKVGIFTVITCMFVGVFMAFYTEYFKNRFEKFFHLLLLMPFILPGVMIVIAFIQLYSETGIINQAIKLLFNLDEAPIRFTGFKGIIFIHAFTQYIYFYINTKISLKFLDQATIESAKSLGATRFQVFKDIILPHIFPAVLTSALMTFATGISSFSAPYLVGGGYRMMSTQILQSKMNNQLQMASTQVIILMFTSIVTMILYSFYNRKNSISRFSKHISTEKVEIENKGEKFLINLIALIIILFISLPLVSILVLSFADSSSWMMEIFPQEFSLVNYKKIFSQKRIFAPIKNSLQMALIAGVSATVIGVLSSYLIIENDNLKSKILNLLILLPIAIPASTQGVNLIMAFNKKRAILFNNSLVGTFAILPIAYTISTVTMASRSTYTAFSNYNPEYSNASRNLGANRFQTFKWVFVPTVISGIVSAFIVSFMKSLGEYTISALLYGVHNRPVSIAMVNALHDFDVGISMAYGSIIIILGLISLSFLSDKEVI